MSPGSSSLTKRRAERIAEDDGLPAERRRGEIERFDEIETGDVGRKQDVRPERAVQEGLGDVARDTCDALPDEVSRQRLRRARERPRVRPPRRAATWAAAPSSSGIRADEHHRQRPGHEAERRGAECGSQDRSIPRTHSQERPSCRGGWRRFEHHPTRGARGNQRLGRRPQPPSATRSAGGPIESSRKSPFRAGEAPRSIRPMTSAWVKPSSRETR